MFKRLYIDNYRCLVNFDLPLKEMTLLLGRNGTGKTSILDVMYALRELLSGRARISDQLIFPSRTLTGWKSNNFQTFEVEVQINEDILIYRVEIDQDINNDRSRISKEILSSNDGQPLFKFENGDVHLFRDNHSAGPIYSADWTESALARVAPRDYNSRLTNFLETMRNVIICGLYPANFEPESTSYDLMLARNAQNFSSWYQHLQLEQPGKVEIFRNILRSIIDGFDGIRLEKVGISSRAFVMDFRENGRKYSLSLDEISDGQRALTALYALVHLSSGLGYTLFLDEPENYLALAEIQPWLMELYEHCGDDIPQAVICSHHPELIDYLGYSHGVSLSRERSGASKWKDISEYQSPASGGLKLSEIIARGWES